MKTIEDTRRRVRTWLDRNLTDRVAAGENGGITVGLDTPTGKTSQGHWPDVLSWALGWRSAGPDLPPGVFLEWATRMLGPTRQELPSRLILDSIDAAATWAGGQYPVMLRLARTRWSVLSGRFPQTATTGTLRLIMGWDQIDVDLLVTTADWFATHPVPDHTWTPRQVPIPGLHAKWLDATGRRALVEQLVGIPALRLRDRPVQTRITYLDPGHAAAGRRRWDIVTAGDLVSLPYPPTVVVIIENRDTAFYFPAQIPGGVAVLGNGDAVVNLITGVQPLIGAATVVYWGDIDADGLRIVSRLRGRGHPVATILMNLTSYDRYARYGTRLDQHGKVIPAGDPTPPPHLTDDETALYRRLTDPDWDGYRRVEQERIPLPAAVDAVTAIPASEMTDGLRLSPDVEDLGCGSNRHAHGVATWP